MILVKLIGIGNDESKRINNDDKDENDSIEKEGYKYNEDKCNNKDNDDDDSDNDDDWKIECINVIVGLMKIIRMIMNEMVMRVIKMVVKIMMIKVIGIVIVIIKFINMIVGLVSITPGHVKLDWLPPPPKVDRINDNNSENNNE